MGPVTSILGVLCAVWLVQAARFLYDLRHLSSLAELDPPVPDTWPTVSVVVPARNEAASVAEALTSRLRDGYPALEVVVVDDRSTDGTREIVAAIASAEPRVTLVTIYELPDGWLGKVNALQRGLEASSGEWVLFSDADVHIAPGALRRAVAHCDEHDLDFLALVPEYRNHSRLVDALWAVFLRAFGIMIDARAVRDPSSRACAGSGAFNLVRRAALERTEGLGWLRLETTDDMALGMMLKRSGARCDLVDGRGCAHVLIYRGLGEFFAGTEKNAGVLLGPHPVLVSLVMVGWLALEWSPLLAVASGLAWGIPWLVALGAVAAAVAWAITVGALRTNTGRIGGALLWPAGSAIFAAAVVRATWKAHAAKGVSWRGTFYPRADLLAARRFRL